MSKQKDGGSAFPMIESNINGEGQTYCFSVGGMSRREWYAGQALAGMLASFSGIFAMLEAGEASRVAKGAYMFADAMIAEGEKQND